MSAAGIANRVPITAGIITAQVMGALDVTVVNVALPHMQGALSATPEQITWVVTSYVIAMAVGTPASGATARPCSARNRRSGDVRHSTSAPMPAASS